MEDNDLPIAYGQHINAEITSQILDSNELLSSILGLTPQKSAGGAGGADSGPLKLIMSLQEAIPEKVDMFALKQK